MIHYIVASKNTFALAGTLILLHIPFEFNPTRKWGKKKVKNGYGRGVFEFDLITDDDIIVKTEGGEITMADIMYAMYDHFGEKTDIEIIHQHQYNG